MIRINLLPEELRKKPSKFKSIDLSGITLETSLLINIAVVVVIVVLVMHMALFFIGSASKNQFNKLVKRYEKILPQKKESDSLKIQNDIIDKKITAINELMVKRFSWARCLDALSDSMANGIWLTELGYEEKSEERPVENKALGSKNKKDQPPDKIVTEKVVTKSLSIIGYAASRGEDGTAVVGRYIKSLKDNARFYSSFYSIDLVSIKSEKMHDQEVMHFKIICIFK